MMIPKVKFYRTHFHHYACAQAEEYATTLRALRKEKDGADRRLKESHGHIERLTERTKAEQATVQREMMDFKVGLELEHI